MNTYSIVYRDASHMGPRRIKAETLVDVDFDADSYVFKTNAEIVAVLKKDLVASIEKESGDSIEMLDDKE